MLRWIVILCGTFGFFAMVYGLSVDSHHIAFTIANSFPVSWAAALSMFFGMILWMRVRTK